MQTDQLTAPNNSGFLPRQYLSWNGNLRTLESLPNLCGSLRHIWSNFFINPNFFFSGVWHSYFCMTSALLNCAEYLRHVIDMTSFLKISWQMKLSAFAAGLISGGDDFARNGYWSKRTQQCSWLSLKLKANQPIFDALSPRFTLVRVKFLRWNPIGQILLINYRPFQQF